MEEIPFREEQPSRTDPHPQPDTHDLFRSVVENSPGLMCCFLPDSTITFANDAYCRFFRRSAAEVEGLRFATIIHHEDRDKVLAALESLTPDHPERTLEHRVLTPDGDVCWQRWTNRARFDEQGRLETIHAHGEDITEYKQIERQLAFTQFTVDQAEIAVFWCRADGRFFYVNETSCRWLQYTREELMQMHVADINPEFPRENWPAHWDEIKEKGLVRMESVHQRKNGEIYPVEIYSNYVRHDGQEYKLAFVHDISERRRTEDEIHGLLAQLYASQKMEAIGRLAGGMAHDLNNLLVPILGFSEILLEDLDETDPRHEAVKPIQQAGRRARDLVRQLLAFGRKQTLEIHNVDVNEVILGMERLLSRTIREDVEIKTVLTDEPVAVRADIGQLEQVIINLVINAGDAMPDGGSVTIETRCHSVDHQDQGVHHDLTPGNYLQITVSDTGEGMDTEVCERVFDPFFTTKEVGKGIGLGLASVYGIVRQHEGHIRVDSEPGLGTTFTLLFPAVAEPAAASETQVRAEKKPTGTETIVVAEDDEGVLQLARSILERVGYRVIAAANGTECLHRLAELDEPPDLLLTDVIMPDMNGKALFRLVEQKHPGTKVLFMSGYTDNVIVSRGVLQSDIAFIQKPFTVEGLTNRVRQVLDSGEMQHEA